MLAALSWRAVTEIHLGPLALRPHGLLIAVGFVGGALLMRRSTRRHGIPDETLWRILSWGLAGGIVGMRLAWVIGHLEEMESPLDLVAVWEGGMSLLGGLIGAVIVGGWAARRERLPLLPLLDMAAPGLALGIAVGRVSDLIIGDHLGKPTNLPWGFRFVGADHTLATSPPVGTIVHPVALYDLLITAVLLFVLLRFARSPRAAGSTIALFALWYATGRVFTDFLRVDPRRAFGLTGSQLTALVLIAAISAALMIRHRRTDDARPDAGDGPAPHPRAGMQTTSRPGSLAGDSAARMSPGD